MTLYSSVYNRYADNYTQYHTSTAGSVQAYLKGRYSKDVYANHYQSCYGVNYASVVMESGQESKPNLLLFTNSMGAGVKYLLAGHFNRIVSIDLHYYKKEFLQPFSLKKAVKEYRIDMILILGENMFFQAQRALFRNVVYSSGSFSSFAALEKRTENACLSPLR